MGAVHMRAGSPPLLLLLEGLLLLAAIGLVPLGLPLTGAEMAGEGRGAPGGRWRRAGLHGAGVALAAALLLRGSPVALLLSAPWLGVTARMALGRLGRLSLHRQPAATEIAGTLAQLYLAGGALWAMVYAGGLVLLGFTGTSALLTAVHFHYAGFCACLLASAIGRALPPSSSRRPVFRVAVVSMCAGIPLLAAGIAGARWLERWAAVDVALALLLLGILLLCRLRDRIPTTARCLSAVAGISALVAGTLALSYSAVGFAGLGPGLLERMVYLHGLCNSLGFATLGLLSFRLAPPNS